jgi:hypothetical protein
MKGKFVANSVICNYTNMENVVDRWKINTNLKYYCADDPSNKRFSVNTSLCSYPSQEELADGWELCKTKKYYSEFKDKQTGKKIKVRQIYENYVTLDKLPPKFWRKMCAFTDVYRTCFTDDFYKFYVKETKYDNMIKQLYRELKSRVMDKNIVNELHDSLAEKGYNGWVLIRAKKMLSNV